MDDRLIKFGAEVKRLRTSKHYSQDYLAKLAGFSCRQSIQLIEKGKTDISIERLTDLSKALDVSPSYFLDMSLAEDDHRIYITELTKDLSPKGLEVLELYVENLRNIPEMTINNPNDNK